MDPLSITASVAALLGLAKMTKHGYLRLRRFADDAKLYDQDLEDTIFSFQLLENVMCGLSYSVADLKDPRYQSPTIEYLIAKDVFGNLTKAASAVTTHVSRKIDHLVNLQARSSLAARIKWITREKAEFKRLELKFKCVETPFNSVVNLVSCEMNKLALKDRLKDPMTDPKEIKRLKRENKRLTKSVHRYEDLIKTLASSLVSAATSADQETQIELVEAIASVLPSIENVVPMTLGRTEFESRQPVNAQGPSPTSRNAALRPDYTSASHTSRSDDSSSATSISGDTPSSLSTLSSLPRTEITDPDADDLFNIPDATPLGATAAPKDVEHVVALGSTPKPRRSVHVIPDNFSTAKQFHILAPHSSQNPGNNLTVTAVIDAGLSVNLVSLRKASELDWARHDLDDQDPKELMFPNGRSERISFKCNVQYFGLKKGRRGSGTTTVFFVCQHLRPEIIVGEQFTWLASDDRHGRTHLLQGFSL